MTRKTTLLLILALTLTALFGLFSVARAGVNVASDGLVELPQVITSTESDEPEIEDIEPDEGEQGQTLDVLITGENTHFDATSEVSFGTGITVNSTTVYSATSLEVNITIAANAAEGKRDVVVTTVTSDFTEVVTKEHGFKVEEADEPEIEDIEPDEGEQGQTLDVLITGENTHFFAPSNVATGTAVSFSPSEGITVNNTTVHSATSLTVNITIAADAAEGKRDVVVTTVITDFTEVVTKTDGFKVEEADEPEIEDIEPDEGEQGQTLDVLITGENTHFFAPSDVATGTAVSFIPSEGITVNNTTVHSATSLTVSISIAANAPVGKRDVVVTTVITDFTEVVTKEDGFKVEEADEPEIKDIEPDEGEQGQTLDVLITGENTHFFAPSNVATGTAVSFIPPEGITVNNTTVHSATSLTVSISIAANATVGRRHVVVTTVTSDFTEVVTKTDGFKVEAAEEVEFEGTIISVTIASDSDLITGTITVATDNEGEWTVHINADTRIRIDCEEGSFDDLEIGQQVEVEGTLQDDGSVLALKLHVELDDDDDDQVGFRGTIEAISEVTAAPPLTLTVQMGPRPLIVVADGDTEIKDADDQPLTFDDLEVGQQIKGEGVLQEDGSILASEIEVLEDHDGPGHGQVRFEGEITALPGGLMGEWTVRTTTFMTVTFSVDVNTKLRPPGFRPEVGDWAKVTAVRQEDDTLLALKVHLKKHKDRPPRPVEFRGTIKSIEGDDRPTKIVVSIWSTTDAEDGLVDVLINSLTRIEGDLWVGAHVEVRGFLQSDGSVLATRIEVEDDDGDEDEVEFKGRIQRIESDMWVVGGFTVLITNTTVITGATPQVGLLAEVKGIRVGPRIVRATEIEVEDPSAGAQQVKVRGIIETLPETDDHTGTWTITTEDDGSVSIEVTSDTVIDTQHGEVEVGALVRVTALRQDDGTLIAQRIKVFESD